MLKPEVVQNPHLLAKYRSLRSILISDDSIERNCAYGLVRRMQAHAQSPEIQGVEGGDEGRTEGGLSSF